MLQTSFIIEHQDAVVQGLTRRGLPQAASLIEAVVATDQQRRSTQGELDTLARYFQYAVQTNRATDESRAAGRGRVGQATNYRTQRSH